MTATRGAGRSEASWVPACRLRDTAEPHAPCHPCNMPRKRGRTKYLDPSSGGSVAERRYLWDRDGSWFPSGCLGESMTVRRRKSASRDRPHLGATSGDAGDNAAEGAADDTGLARFVAATRGGVTRAQQWLARYEGVPVVDVVVGTFRRDRRAAGSVMSSAL